MNFDFAGAINPYLEKGRFEEAIQFAESQLTAILASPFHSIIGKSLLDQTESLCSWINNFYKTAAATVSVKALYFEINEFDISTDKWYIDGFAYQQDGGLDDQEWLADLDEAASSNCAFVLLGYESLQRAFEEAEADSDELQDAQDWCEQLILVRYRQLMQAAHQRALKKGFFWAQLPVYCTEHGYDFITQSINK